LTYSDKKIPSRELMNRRNYLYRVHLKKLCDINGKLMFSKATLKMKNKALELANEQIKAEFLLKKLELLDD